MRIVLLLFWLGTVLLAQGSKWSHDYQKALQKAKKEHKPVYILIVSDTCRWCKKFEEVTLNDPKIKERINKEFVTVILSRDKDEIPKYFKVSPIPRHYFVNCKGNILFSSFGYRDADIFDFFMLTAHIKYEKQKERDNETSTNK